MITAVCPQCCPATILPLVSHLTTHVPLHSQGLVHTARREQPGLGLCFCGSLWGAECEDLLHPKVNPVLCTHSSSCNRWNCCANVLELPLASQRISHLAPGAAASVGALGFTELSGAHITVLNKSSSPHSKAFPLPRNCPLSWTTGSLFPSLGVLLSASQVFAGVSLTEAWLVSPVSLPLVPHLAVDQAPNLRSNLI